MDVRSLAQSHRDTEWSSWDPDAGILMLPQQNLYPMYRTETKIVVTIKTVEIHRQQSKCKRTQAQW
jgi:hypothetical protein